MPVPVRILALFIFSALAAQAAVQPPALPGADAHEAVECGDGDAYIYDQYIIYTRPSPAFAGQDIFVFGRRNGGNGPCALDTEDAPYAINAGEFGGANTFLGMRGDYLLIDEWPGRDHKRILIVNAGARSLVFFDWYTDPRIEDGTLRYKRVLKASGSTRESIPCPGAGKWEEEGSLVLYTEKMTLDLGTMKSAHSGEFSCEPAPKPARAQRYNR